MKTLVVMSGGGMPGLSIYAGILHAFAMRDVRADEVHGTSAGAIAGALWMAKDFDGLAASALIMSFRDADVRDPLPFWRTRHRWLNHFMRGKKVQAIVEEHLPWLVSDLPGVFRAYMVQDGTGEVYACEGNDYLWESVRASSAIRGVFPPVQMKNGLYYSDGGTKRNVPLPSHWREFDRVILCIATQPVDYTWRSGIITNLFTSIGELMEAQVERVLDEVRDEIGKKVIVIRPRVATSASTLRFDHALSITAEREARAALDVWSATHNPEGKLL